MNVGRVDLVGATAGGRATTRTRRSNESTIGSVQPIATSAPSSIGATSAAEPAGTVDAVGVGDRDHIVGGVRDRDVAAPRDVRAGLLEQGEAVRGAQRRQRAVRGTTVDDHDLVGRCASARRWTRGTRRCAPRRSTRWRSARSSWAGGRDGVAVGVEGSARGRLPGIPGGPRAPLLHEVVMEARGRSADVRAPPRSRRRRPDRPAAPRRPPSRPPRACVDPSTATPRCIASRSGSPNPS